MFKHIACTILLIGVCLGSADAQSIRLNISNTMPYDAYDDGSLYQMGMEINNCSANYLDLFLMTLARQYDVPRSVLRYYLKVGFTPSDLLMGLEMSLRAGLPLQAVMQNYYNSRNRDWMTLAIRWGIGQNTATFELILNQMRRQYVYWNGYYAQRHGGMRPPMYTHKWSYFRPREVRPYDPSRSLWGAPGPIRQPKPSRIPDRYLRHEYGKGRDYDREDEHEDDSPRNNVYGQPRGNGYTQQSSSDRQSNGNQIRNNNQVRNNGSGSSADTYRHSEQNQTRESNRDERQQNRSTTSNNRSEQSNYRRNSSSSKSGKESKSQQSSDTKNEDTGYRR